MATVSANLAINPLYMQAVVGDTPITYNAIDLRFLIGAAFPRTGRAGQSDSLWVYQRAAGVDWSIDVTTGYAVVGDPSGYDRYLVVNAVRTNIPLTGFNTAPSAVRTHRVFITVDDKNYVGAATYGGRIVVTEDTGTGAPLPTGAAYYMELATFTITTGQSNIGNANINVSAPRASQAPATINLALSTGFIATTIIDGGVPMVRMDGNSIVLSGMVSRSASALYAAGTNYDIATVSPSHRPPHSRYLSGIGYLSQTYRLGITPGGVITAYIPAGVTAMSWISLDGLSYDLEG